ncbi:unnamed protein product, partial [marine sediment metagenome]
NNLVGQSIIINKSVIYIHEKVSIEIDLTEMNDAAETFVFTLFEQIFVLNLHFQKPFNVRTFLGKYSKGKLVDRTQLEKKITVNIDQKNKTIMIYRALNYDVFVHENHFYLTIVPNYEIYSEILDLPLNKKIIPILNESKEYLETVYQTPNKMHERFSEISNNLLSTIKNFKIISCFKEGITISETQLDYPTNFIVLSQDNIANFSDATPFKNQVYNFLKRIENLERYNITILIDEFELTQEDEEYIDSYMKKLSEFKLFKVVNIVKLRKVNEISADISSNVLFILNDHTKGWDFLYTYIKKLPFISKIIKISTIKKMHINDYHFHTLWLSFQYRNTNKLIWYSNLNPFTKVISINAYFNINYGDYNINVSILDTTDYKVSHFNENFQLPDDVNLTEMLRVFSLTLV